MADNAALDVCIIQGTFVAVIFHVIRRYPDLHRLIPGNNLNPFEYEPISVMNDKYAGWTRKTITNIDLETLPGHQNWFHAVANDIDDL